MKTETLKGIATIHKTGSACVGMCGFETEYVIFKVYPDEHSEQFVFVKWHSDNIHKVFMDQDHLKLHQIKETQAYLDFEALVRPKSKGVDFQVWRIKNIKYR